MVQMICRANLASHLAQVFWEVHLWPWYPSVQGAFRATKNKKTKPSLLSSLGGGHQGFTSWLSAGAATSLLSWETLSATKTVRKTPVTAELIDFTGIAYMFRENQTPLHLRKIYILFYPVNTYDADPVAWLAHIDQIIFENNINRAGQLTYTSRFQRNIVDFPACKQRTRRSWFWHLLNAQSLVVMKEAQTIFGCEQVSIVVSKLF